MAITDPPNYNGTGYIYSDSINITSHSHTIGSSYYMINPYDECVQTEQEEEVSQYFQPDLFTPFMKILSSKMSVEDSKTIVKFIFDEISKGDNSSIKLSPTIETAILQFFVEAQ